MDQKNKDTQIGGVSSNKCIFEGLSFKGEPVSQKDYIEHYTEYVARCSIQKLLDDQKAKAVRT